MDAKSPRVGRAKPNNLEASMNHSKEVRDFIVSNFLFGDGATLQDDTSLLDSGTVDSTGVLELIMFLEEKYALRIDPDEVIPDNLDSINKIVRFLKEKHTAVAPVA
jgi:acyl carrier protein